MKDHYEILGDLVRDNGIKEVLMSLSSLCEDAANVVTDGVNNENTSLSGAWIRAEELIRGLASNPEIRILP